MAPKSKEEGRVVNSVEKVRESGSKVAQESLANMREARGEVDDKKQMEERRSRLRWR